MKKKAIIKITRILALLLAVCMLSSTLISCKENGQGEVENPILESDRYAIPLSFYELLLSRIKGNLARNKYEVTSPDFWVEQMEESELSREEYFNSLAFENCKSYLAAAIMFDELGLKLSEDTLAAIDEEIAYSISYDGYDDLDKFNALMARFGSDADSLKVAYIIEAKYEALRYYLYLDGALISDAVKEEYYQDNYYRFKQILVSNFYYEYERDTQGNIIYFNTENGKPVYDSENGTYIYDENGNRVRDDHGNTVYYDKNGTILYDKIKGKPSVVVDENGEGIKHYYTPEEMAERKLSAEEIVTSVTKGNYSAFETRIPSFTIVEGADESYPDGYYLSDISAGGYEEYLSDIFSELKNIEIGESAIVNSDYGYHVIMRYPLDSGKYSNGSYAEWFEGFDDALINKLFSEKCAEYFGDMAVNEENFSKAKSITTIGTNYYY
jgi:hypothetical protein